MNWANLGPETLQIVKSAAAPATAGKARRASTRFAGLQRGGAVTEFFDHRVMVVIVPLFVHGRSVATHADLRKVRDLDSQFLSGAPALALWDHAVGQAHLERFMRADRTAASPSPNASSAAASRRSAVSPLISPPLS